MAPHELWLLAPATACRRAVFILAALALSAIGLTILFQRHVERWVDAELSADLDQLIAGIDAGLDGQLAVTRSPADPRFQRALSGLYWQVNVEPDGPGFRSRSLWDFEIALPAEREVDDKVHSYGCRSRRANAASSAAAR